jgi:malonate transporter
VVLLILTGFGASAMRWIRPEGTRDLGVLVFRVLIPALLFRSMSAVHVEQLNFRPVLLYFAGAVLVYTSIFFWKNKNKHAAVVALAATFSNVVMIGIPLVTLLYGQAGVVVLLTLIAVHSMILLTAATVVFEVVQARESQAKGGQFTDQPSMRQAVLQALKNSCLHPVPMPIVAGLLMAQTGWVLPTVVDRPLHVLGAAFGPMALLLVGASLHQTRIGAHLTAALLVTVLKNLVLPGVVSLLFVLSGTYGLEMQVMVLAAALPMGTNVFMFSQRYAVAQELITASMAVTTLSGLLTISLVIGLLQWVPLA